MDNILLQKEQITRYTGILYAWKRYLYPNRFKANNVSNLKGAAIKHMDIYIKYANIFINDPKNSPLKLGQVSLILTVYASDVVHFQITNNFFSKIDLVKLTKRFQEKSIDSSYSISVLNALVPRIYSYLKGLDSIEIKDKLVIKSIIEEIDLNYYVEYINKKISEEWGNTSTPFESEKTMASVLRTISSYLLRLSSLTDDEQIQNSTNRKIINIFFSYRF